MVEYLLDLNSGKQLAVAFRSNPQTSYEDNVVARIQYANMNRDSLDYLDE
jgi:uncharacterized 2Fe-2S/4Fe-4S cluster protein (DUF4445 family)